MSCGTENVVLEPVDVYIGKDQKQKQKITCVADTAAKPLANRYFLLPHSSGDRYYVWMSLAGGGTDPALPGMTGIEVTYTALMSATAIAGAVQAAIDAEADFVATVSGKVVEVEDSAIGYSPAASDSQIANKQTGFAFDMLVVGDLFEKIGLLDGDVELSGLTAEMVDIMAHQFGQTKLGQLRSSAGSPEIAATLKEVSKDKIGKLVRYSSGEYLPEADGSTGLVGGGLVGLFKPVLNTRVVLHPVSKDIADKSRDVCLWKATIDIESMPFSGENILTMPFKVKGNYDCDKPKPVAVWCYGDWTQVEAQ